MSTFAFIKETKTRWLTRVIWLVTACFAIYFFILDFPFRLETYSSVCGDEKICLETGQLNLEEALQLSQLGLSLDAFAGFKVFLEIVKVLVYFSVSSLLLFRKEQPWFNLYVSLVFLSLGIGLSYNFLADHPTQFIMYHFISNFGATYLVLFYLLPDGKFVPRWTVAIALFWIMVGVFSVYFKGSVMDVENWPIWLGAFFWISFHVILIFSQIYRYRKRSDAIIRQQMKWYVYSIIMYVIALLLLNFVGPLSISLKMATEFVYALSSILIPLSIGFAIFKYRLWDINIIIHRTVLYGILSILVVLFYSVSVSVLSLYIVEEDRMISSLITAGIIAFCFQPVKVKLQSFVNRLVYGDRDNPLFILTQLNSILTAASSMEKVLPLVVTTLAKTLKIPYVAIRLIEQETSYIAASFGKPSEVDREIPLFYQGNRLGSLLLSSRDSHEPFRPSDMRLLDGLAQQVGIVAQSILLHKDLQRSRSQLVLAREEERRRLRRDLHDGLGPSLASIKMKLDVAESFIEAKPESTAKIIHETGNQLKKMIEEIRTLVYSLRPPVLDELGLVAAIREMCNHYSQSEINFSVVSIPEPLPALPAAAEIAVYRIAQEAITNVVRHSSANECSITIDAENENLHVTIVDNGIGISDETFKKGIGFHSMKERAEELGGTAIIENLPDGGLKVFAKIPIQ
ncbi:GAF domain-containing sensor histidine kinase [Neobacillus sp. YIM B06451]|uniref:sensor histidine kinase n=1 Tax=Neobacillus sp. YIM B06451 TaxID=3070994 RepID=UPI002931AC47|nr:GAF domain-containing sensor histidine kinase [Neobacillus sp. YIM B06451]